LLAGFNEKEKGMAHLINRVFSRVGRPLVNRVAVVPEAAPKVEASSGDVFKDLGVERPKLTGSRKYRGEFKVGDHVVSDKEITAMAWSRSGLTPDEWNALKADERVAYIESTIASF
jgi:hypothetical protein